MKIRYFGKSDVGLQRTNNEDSILIDGPLQLFILADGMGGHAGGEEASRIAVESIRDFVEHTASDEESTWPFEIDPGVAQAGRRLVVGVMIANSNIIQAAKKNRDLKGMGTTVVSLFVNGEKGYLAHVGDSRIYRLRNNQLTRMTEDHSMLNEELKRRKMTEEEIRNYPYKNRIVRALGHMEKVKVDLKEVDLRPNDYFLLCSDGLTDLVSDREIQQTMIDSGNDCEAAANTLVEKANGYGGKDNVSVVAVRFE
jgi:protein phosphatase